MKELVAETFPELLATDVPPFCPLCGRFRIWCFDGTCSWCGAVATEWRFLKDVESLAPETSFTVRCPWVKGYPDAKRCQGTRGFTVAVLERSVHTGGNGPNTYLLECRFGFQGSCSKGCSVAHSDNLIRSNHDVLLSLLEPAS